MALAHVTTGSKHITVGVGVGEDPTMEVMATWATVTGIKTGMVATLGPRTGGTRMHHAATTSYFVSLFG